MKNERLKAAERGDSTYEGDPCPKCGSTVRYVIYNQCKPCTNERSYKNQKLRAQRYRDLIKQARAETQ